jgi:hypothetical protein
MIGRVGGMHRKKRPLTNNADPRATSTFVRRPAARWHHSRSTPITVPRTNAHPKRTVNAIVVMIR